MSRKKSFTFDHFRKNDYDLPVVSLVISAFNEEDMLDQKLDSIFNTDYPLQKLEVLIGSDASTDNTVAILKEYAGRFPQLRYFDFKTRRGKGNVINELQEHATGDIVIFSDANVMLERSTIFELVKYFKTPDIGLVDTRMINTNMHQSGISYQEKAYISREVLIKQHESLLWGTMMGPFGGCFAIRRHLYFPVPPNFFVDDFFINMKILDQGYKCINNMEARVFEDVSNNLKDEYRRKVRISTGNFQNLRYFSHLLASKTRGLSFCYISHKVLRWIGPFWMIVAFTAHAWLSQTGPFYFYTFLLHCFLFVVPLLDILMQKLKINSGVLRFVTHFYSMNLALLAGFFKSFKKIESNVWKPTQRNQV